MTIKEASAHELAHQWLGDYVTCGTWKDIWMNEGGATWSETLWEEKAFGVDNGVYDLNQIKREYFREGGMELHQIYDMPMDDLFSTGITYNKAAWVYAMLRYQVGDDVFFPAFKKIYEYIQTNICRYSRCCKILDKRTPKL